MNRRCPVCGATDPQVLHQQALVLPDQIRFPSMFDVVGCEQCGMVYSDIATTSEQLTDYYAMESYSANHWAKQPDLASSSTTQVPDIDRKRLSTVAKYLGDAITDRTVRVLEIGSASGELLAQLRDDGFSDLLGIEPSPGAVEQTRQRGLRAELGQAANIPKDLGTFGLVIINHVLEHLVDPREFVQSLISHVDAGGLVYVEVPDAARFADYFQEPFEDFNMEHINHFSPEYLDLLMSQAGFTTVDTGNKTIELAVGWPYPSTFGLWRNDPGRANSVASTRPVSLHGLRESISRYIDLSFAAQKTLGDRLLQTLGSQRKVAVRGLGHRAWHMLGSPAFRELEIVAFIDASPSKQKLTIDGNPIVGVHFPLPRGIPIIPLVHHLEEVIAEEYRTTEPDRHVVKIGSCNPRS